MTESNFEAVGRFHTKFALPTSDSDSVSHQLDDAAFKFRFHFMLEELEEYRTAHVNGDLAGQADALIDLVYVVMGTAHMHGFPWQELWDEVQRANMGKERCGIDHKFEESFKGIANACGDCSRPRAAHSIRGSALDVIKPAGWTAPDIEGVLRKSGKRG